MSNIEAIVILYSVFVQPFLIRFIAKDSKSSGYRITCVVLLSIIAGILAYIVEYGRIWDPAKIGEAVVTILALSVSTWSMAWKKILPYKDDPLSEIDIDKLNKR